MGEDSDNKPTNSVHKMADLAEELRCFREELFSDIKSQIQSVYEEIQEDIAALREETKADLRALRNELSSEIKSALSSVSEEQRGAALRDLVERITALEQRHVNTNMCLKSPDQDSQGRTSLRIVGVAEGAEGEEDLLGFVRNFLSLVLGAEHFGDSPVNIEQAYRLPAPNSKRHNKPRAIIVHFQNSSDAKKVLKLARKKDHLLYSGAPVHIIPDISSEDGWSGALFRPNKIPGVISPMGSDDGSSADSFCTDEQGYAYSWIQNNLEQHPDTSIPKQVVYDSYRKDCESKKIPPLSVSTFGKIFKDILPNVQARRLGGRGQSKYCYCGIRRRTKRQNVDIYSSDEDEPVKPKAEVLSDEDEVQPAELRIVQSDGGFVAPLPVKIVEYTDAEFDAPVQKKIRLQSPEDEEEILIKKEVIDPEEDEAYHVVTEPRPESFN